MRPGRIRHDETDPRNGLLLQTEKAGRHQAYMSVDMSEYLADVIILCGQPMASPDVTNRMQESQHRISSACFWLRSHRREI
ncbi:uncharacterized protein YALI1_D10243g [Yarrowia lipolytica]|uniref:Uncharacterized protein n=1 Tax=Yarrowia lipolytica TaxID=4952 RepID=A0A1D8NDQ5_YARLL|nr:hypothetical protein YALI1_D10243g [Yarrowia lipolytica]